jgi:hypothetical protein
MAALELTKFTVCPIVINVSAHAALANFSVDDGVPAAAMLLAIRLE